MRRKKRKEEERRDDEGWFEEKSKKWKRDWGTDEEKGTTHNLWEIRERNFEGLENMKGMLHHFKIFCGHKYRPSII